MRDAIMPITAFSYGMKDRQRIKESVKYGQIYTAVIMLIGFAAIELLAEPFSNIFGLSGETKYLCVSAMRIVSVSFVFAGINIAFQGIFQAINGGIESLMISFGRQIIFVFPFALIFAKTAQIHAGTEWLSWVTFTIAELLTAIIAVILFKQKWEKTIKRI